ncbi:hypothetical protein Mapa_002791 [Marchantia paleacea]|nr:hypothetical protein Mapa_002791 [Marchantia paleacea]
MRQRGSETHSMHVRKGSIRRALLPGWPSSRVCDEASAEQLCLAILCHSERCATAWNTGERSYEGGGGQSQLHHSAQQRRQQQCAR